MYERFTDRARRVMMLATKAAKARSQEFLSTEHILLGLLDEGGGTLAKLALMKHGITLEKVRVELTRTFGGPGTISDTVGRLPLTPSGLQLIANAIQAARNLNNNYVGTEHLLIGLLSNEQSVAASVILNLGVEPKDILNTVNSYIAKPTELLNVPEIGDLARSLVAMFLDSYAINYDVANQSEVASKVREVATILRTL
jgi:ATP-dependent Clp protease ATP-binding subunit ClpC